MAMKHLADVSFKKVIANAGFVFGIKIIGISLAFILNIAVTRKLGAYDAGLYFLTVNIVGVLSVIGRLGYDNALVRLIATNNAVSDWSAIKGIYLFCVRTALFISLLISLIFFMAADFASANLFDKPRLAEIIKIMALSLPFLVLLNLHVSVFNGFQKVIVSQTFGAIIIPLIMLFGILLLSNDLKADSVAFLNLMAVVFSAGLIFFLWKIFAGKALRCPAKNKNREVAKISIPMLWVSTVGILLSSSSVLLLGVMSGPEDVALYNVAARTAMLLSFVLAAVNVSVAPKFAELWERGECEKLESLAKKSSFLMLLLVIPLVVIMMVFSADIVRLFGPDFEKASMVLRILALGQFVNVASGSVGYLLLMCGKESIERYNTLIALIFCIVCGCALIPAYGITGAALSMFFTLVLKNVAGIFLVRKYLHFYPVGRFW